MAPSVVTLQPNEYESSLNALREKVKQRAGYIDVQLQLPFSNTEVHLQLRCTDLYIIGFKGKALSDEHDGWYCFKGFEADSWARDRPNCGVEGNYNKLATVDTVDVPQVDNLVVLTKFKSEEGLNNEKKKAIVIAIAVVSEALRFANVAILFAELFGWVDEVTKKYHKRDNVPVGQLKDQFFLKWDYWSQQNVPGVLLKKLD